ncbi:guanylate kinase [Caulifigura coniformis]|uniref:guanylate kinase n=1 Tax=Caulifigura coniformis TaxID=2527983 RepID=UPI0011A130F2|nr:guanylate kinase [Caulifigura coniformis]
MSTASSASPSLPAVHRIVVLSGPSGSGKTTIVKRLLAESPIPLRMSVSATTRPMRVGEENGRDYYFLSPEEFESRRVAGEFLEYAEVHKSGYWYGTLVSEMGRAHSEGKWSLLEVDVQGAMSVMERFPDAISIFLMTPDVQEYERRLRSRGTESEAILQRRLQTAIEELKLADSYRYRVVNDNLDHAVSEICRVLAAEAKHV